jgi:hypothetical protein
MAGIAVVLRLFEREGVPVDAATQGRAPGAGRTGTAAAQAEDRREAAILIRAESRKAAGENSGEAPVAGGSDRPTGQASDDGIASRSE